MYSRTRSLRDAVMYGGALLGKNFASKGLKRCVGQLSLRSPVRGGSMHRAIAPGQASLAELDRLHRSGVRVDSVDEWGLTCLFVAAAAGEREVIEWLLEHGAHAGPINQEDGRSALHAASAAGHADVVARLLDADGADSTLRDGAGLTAAEVAQQAAHLDVVRVFAEHAAKQLKQELVAARQLARGGS